MSTQLHYDQPYRAKRPFEYDGQLDMDQVFHLKGAINDERLVRLNFCDVVPKGTRVVQCGKCGAKFTTEFGLNMHGKKRHSDRPRGPDIQDAPLNPRPVSPAEIQAQLNGNTFLSAAELAQMGGTPPEENDDAELKRALLDPDRAIRMDRTRASMESGEGVYELQGSGAGSTFVEEPEVGSEEAPETPEPAPEPVAETRRSRRRASAITEE